MSKFIEGDFKGSYKIIFNFLVEKGSEDSSFKEKLESSEQTAESLTKYIRGQAKEMAEEGCAMVPKEKVYGWAIHFIDENIQDKEILVPKKVISKTVKVAAEANKKAVIVKKAIDKYESKELIRNVKGKKDKSVDGQVSIFDF